MLYWNTDVNSDVMTFPAPTSDFQVKWNAFYIIPLMSSVVQMQKQSKQQQKKELKIKKQPKVYSLLFKLS